MTHTKTNRPQGKLDSPDITFGHGDVTAHGKLDHSVFTALHDAALAPDREACKAVIQIAEKRGISQVSLADDYIPAVAQHMGNMWCEDQLGFANVTIGVARLQALLRELGPEWCADTAAAPNNPSILLITPRHASHTLGAVVLAGQLRRRGYSVRIAFDVDRQALADLLDRIAFDAIFISAARSESLENLRRMIEFTRTLSHRHLPVAIGGSVLETTADVAAMTGADIMTSNIEEAIAFCGLHHRTHQKSAASAVGT